MVVNKLVTAQNKRFPGKDVLSESGLPNSLQSALHNEVTAVLNYKRNDHKYSELTSIEVDEETVKSVARKDLQSIYSRKKQVKPDVMDFWSEDFIVERPKLDFEHHFTSTEDNRIDAKPDFDFLNHLYESTEIFLDDS